jgi:hypothetical protein
MPKQPDRPHANRATRWLAHLALAAGALGAAGAGAASDDGPTPFSASYAVTWKGINVGTSTLRLTRDAAGRYTYVSRNQARGIFRIAFPDDIIQQSEFRIDAGQVRPDRFRGDDGSSDTAKDVTLDFDWEANRVRGVAEQRPVDLALQPGLQDPMSVQIELMVELAAGRTPDKFWMIDKDKLKDYVYTHEGKARLATELGSLETVIYSSRRPGSDRVTRIWYAQSLGWAPVRAERRRGADLEWSMNVRSLQRTP